MSDPVVVFGASGYVGGYTVRALLARGHRVIAVTRRPAMARILLAEESAELTIGSAEDARRLIGGANCTIVNLAFVKKADPGWIYRQNRELMSSIERVASERCRRLIHISTAAVLDSVAASNPAPVRLTKAPPDLYGESKLHAEHLIEKIAERASCELAIVRLGNVIGPGSPAWMATIAQRLLEVKPLAYEGANGYSNATHVQNVGEYLAHLVDSPPGALSAHGTYHHLAEFSARRWPVLLDVISAEVGFPWTSVSRPPPASSGGSPVKRALKAANRTDAGRYLRAGLGLIPDPRALERFNSWVRSPVPPSVAPTGAVGAEDFALLEVLSTENEFPSHAIEGWSPTLGFEAACEGIAEWVRDSGFSIKP